MRFLRLFAALMLAPFAAQAAEPADSKPPLFYVIALSSEVVSLDSLGLTPGVTGDANRKSTLLHPIACIGGECRRIVDPPLAHDRNWHRAVLAQEPTQAGRLAFMLVSFDGYYLSVSTHIMEMWLDGSGRPRYGTKTMVQYAGECTLSQPAEGPPPEQRPDSPTSSRMRNYQLEMLQWSGCTNERFLKALGLSFERIAAFWEERLAPESGSVLAEKLANWQKLPLVRDVIGKDAADCRPAYGDYHLVKDLGEYLWLAFPEARIQGPNSVFIAQRCAVDSG